MTVIGKTEFFTEIGISGVKLDSLMKELGLEYETTPKDKKIKVVSEINQKKIKNYLGIKDNK